MIGVFDSGVGGITILNRVREKIPSEDYLYVADQKYIPYGNKPISIIKNRAVKISQFLIAHGASTIVVACNTATVAVIKNLRQHFPNVTFIGTEPAVRKAAVIKNAPVLVLATQRTLRSSRVKQLAKMYSPQNRIIFRDVPTWVTLAESGQFSGPKVRHQIKKDLDSLDVNKIAALVIACTHYNFFIPLIKKLHPHLSIYDPLEGVTKRLASLHRPHRGSGGLQAFTTGNSHHRRILSRLLKDAISVQSITL